jgi:Family of unknown function (DUF5947)
VSETGLRRFARVEPVRERCELCGATLDPEHRHVVAPHRRALLCACRACHLLFTGAGTGGGRLRSVPQRYLTDAAHRLAAADWDGLQIPVGTAYLFTNGALDRTVACYPSPAGATECLLDLDGWQRLRRCYPLLAAAAPDVEAIYVTRTGAGPEAFLVPIDACYRLAGAVRSRWRGIDGGEPVRQTLSRFLEELRGRCRPLRPGEE